MKPPGAAAMFQRTTAKWGCRGQLRSSPAAQSDAIDGLQDQPVLAKGSWEIRAGYLRQFEEDS